MDKEKLFLILLVEFVVILIVFFVLFTASGGWYKTILFDSIDCQEWEIISESIGKQHDSRIPEHLNDSVMSFDEKVDNWLEYCN